MSDSFAVLLKRHRREAGLSQEALAEGAAISKDAVSALERGTRRAPYRDTVELLARALQLDEVARRGLEEAAARGRAARLHSARDGIHASNLPLMGTMLVGREDAVEAVLEQIDEHPIVTIVGPGGIGKTRVAIDAGERFVEARGIGAWFCDLAAVMLNAPIAAKIASAVGVAALGTGDVSEELATRLRSREGVLVLDNCEHVIDEAAKAAAAIAAHCPGLKVLATSRQRLALSSEHVYRLGALGNAAARELFRMRAASAGLSLTTADTVAVDEICTAVDNIPLAIELAAARAPLLGLSELRIRLKGQLAMLSGGDRDAPSRQRTMEATIGWSYDLLDEIERAVFHRCAVFAGGWPLHALESVIVTPPIDRDAVLPAFTSLVEKSLVTADLEADPVRYRLLEPIRAFALQRLQAVAELEFATKRHAQWIADFTTGAAQSDEDSHAPGVIAAVGRELDNARAALETSLEPSGDVAVAARIVQGLHNYWVTTGFDPECRHWCERILAKLDIDADPAVAIPVFNTLISSIEQADKQMDAILCALPVYERAADWRGLAAAYSLLGVRYADAGRFDDAQLALERVEQIRTERQLPPNADWVVALMHRGYLFRLKNQFEEAAAVLDEAVALARKVKRPFYEMWGSVLSGEMAFALGDHEKAIAIATDALAKIVRYGYTNIETFARSNLGGYYLAKGDLEQARAQARRAISLVGNVDTHILTAILHLAAAGALSGAYREAARLKGYCDVGYSERKTMQDPNEISSYAILVSALEAQLSTSEIAELESEGAQLDDREAAELTRLLSAPS